MSAKRTISDIMSDGKIRTSAELASLGVSRLTQRRLMERNEIFQYCRGIYITLDMMGENGLDFAVLSKLKRGVVCLLSAAAYHELGDVDPGSVWYAVDRTKMKNSQVGSFSSPHTLMFWTPEFLTEGIEIHEMLGVDVKITSPARTIVDLFRYRNRIGLDPALKGLADYIKSGRDIQDIWNIAYKLKVNDSIEPYVVMADELKESIPQRGPK